MRGILSRLKTKFYRQPKDEVKRLVRWGPIAYMRCSAWAARMEEYAKTLKPPDLDCGFEGHASLWFLTGKRFWYQTAFCAWTFSLYSKYNVELNLLDDGSLGDEQIYFLRRLFPEGRTIMRADSLSTLEARLPQNRFPVLHSRWNKYINIRKLIDVHLNTVGPKLVLDSDMLFFKKPTDLLDWIDSKQGMCLMTDCEESYGYSRSLMERLAGCSIPNELNVGITGIRSEDIDWEELESWCRVLIETEGMSYFLEQALIAMIAARNSKLYVMSKEDYITFPSKKQVNEGSGVLQHYVSDSKPWYFKTGWKSASGIADR